MVAKKEKVWKIISVGGSIIIPKTGFEPKFLTEFRDLIIKYVKQGEQFILMVGGGATARQYQEAGREVGLSTRDLDWIGIYATLINANFVRHLFSQVAHKEVISNPTKKIRTKKPCLPPLSRKNSGQFIF